MHRYTCITESIFAPCNLPAVAAMSEQSAMRPSTLLLVITAAVLHAQNWPMYLRDPSHSSYNPIESLLSPANVSRLEPIWTISAGGTISTGVTHADGMLFFGAWDG